MSKHQLRIEFFLSLFNFVKYILLIHESQNQCLEIGGVTWAKLVQDWLESIFELEFSDQAWFICHLNPNEDELINQLDYSEQVEINSSLYSAWNKINWRQFKFELTYNWFKQLNLEND